MTRLRRPIQFCAILLLLALPLLSRGSALYQSYGAGASHVGELAGPWENLLFSAFDAIFGWLDDPASAADLFQGSYWSITLFGITFSDPLAFLGHLAARGAVHWQLAAGIVFSVLVAAVAGRFFCGWICPVNTLLELNAAVRGWIERRVVVQHLPAFVAPSRARWTVLLAALIVSAVAGFNLFAFILPYIGLARDWHLFVFGTAIGFGVLFMLIIVAAELLIAPRFWCRSLCPTGLVLELLGRWRMVRIKRKPTGTCPTGCQACLAACPVGVNPRGEVATDQCLLCNACVSRCPSQILGLGKVRKAPVSRKQAAGASLVVILLLALGGGAAMAHHIKGLPHYGYLENYPQTPTREVRFDAPPYRVTLVAYVMEGLKRERSDTPDAVMVYVSVADGRNGKAHTGPLQVTFRPEAGGEPLVRTFKKPLEETVYRMRVALAAPAYDVAIDIGRGRQFTAATRLSLAEGGLNAWTTAILAVITAVVLVVVVSYLRRRARRRNWAAAGE